MTTKAYVIDGAFRGADAFSLIDGSDAEQIATTTRADGLGELPAASS